ncbi:TonB family protein [Caulobacter sp.]|uniref:TonB family protein n=1 Tax=Caulobacter sp. TaxID=78 RepID=UPI001614E019
MRGLLLALAVLSPVTAAANVAPPPGDLSPMMLVSFTPPAVTCAQGSPRLIEGVTPSPRFWQSWRPPAESKAPPPPPPVSAIHTFSVDAEGRVLDLVKTTPSTHWLDQEQAAAIASWRFAPGAPATGCTAGLTPTYSLMAEASPARLFEVLVTEGRNTPPPVRKALASAGDCYAAGVRRRPQVIVYPDLRAFDDKSLDPPWAAVRYDIDARGAVRNVRIAAQNGEVAFADSVASAVAEAKYFPGPARTGCFTSFKALPRATQAPPMPSIASFARPGDTCAVPPETLNLPKVRTYPSAYDKRRVAGWAIVRFDVAPWGQVGAVEVLAAQPSAAFGDTARNLVLSARPNAPASGYHGCVLPITYAIPPAPDDD